MIFQQMNFEISFHNMQMGTITQLRETEEW